MRYGTQKIKLDFPFLVSLLFLLTIGTTILLSVEPRLFPLQWIYLLGGILIFAFATRLDKIILEALAPFIFGIILLALLATLVLGIVSNGAIRWLPLGELTLQPSEFAKPAIVLITAWVFSKNLKHRFLLSLLFAILISILVFLQPDLGTTIILIVAFLGSLLGGGVNLRSLGFLLIFGMAVLPLIWFLLLPYQRERVLSFAAPRDFQGASYQAVQGMIASGSGGFFGRGLGQGSQTQLAFLPEGHTDFVFASLGEELGFFGMSLVIVSFLVLLWRIVGIFSELHDPFATRVVSGIFAYLFFQVFFNISMNLGLLPIAGVPLPLISAGGSALISTMFSLGVVVAMRK